MEERKCWICGRKKEDIINDSEKLQIDGSIFDVGVIHKEEAFFYKSDVGADICLVCKCIIADVALDQADVKFDERIGELKIESTLIN